MSICWKEKEFEKKFIEAVKTSTTIADVLRKIGNLMCTGGNYTQVHKHVKRLNLDITHWLGRAHLKGKKRPSIKGKPLTEILVKDSSYSSKNLKPRLLTAGLLKYSCAVCGLSAWQNKSLVLQFDHKNGDNTDNTLDNLRLLCPNCHSQTPTYCGRNRGYMSGKTSERTTTCPHCKGFKNKPSKLCRVCASVARRGSNTKIVWPSNEALLALLKNTPFTVVARSLGVSDNAIRKHLKVVFVTGETTKTPGLVDRRSTWK